MKEVRVAFDDKMFKKMLKQKEKIESTWKIIILKGLGLYGNKKV